EENSQKKTNVSMLNCCPNKKLTIPARPKLKNIIAKRMTASPSHFPHKKAYAEIGYVESNPHCPLSFSVVAENPPNKRVINGNKYRVIFITVPVISVYPSEVEAPDCNSRMAMVKMDNRIRKE